METGKYYYRHSFRFLCANTLFYNRTFPPMNILLYNAIGGDGDQLYGVESAAYYLKALVLNTGAAFPICCCTFVVTTFQLYLKFYGPNGKTYVAFNNSVVQRIVMALTLALWLLILFSRPHKVRQ